MTREGSKPRRAPVVSLEPPDTRLRFVWLAIAIALGLSLASLFAWSAPAPDERDENTPPAPSAPTPRTPKPQASPQPAEPMIEPSATAEAQVPAVPAIDEFGPDDHPHPITPERRAIQRELQLIGALNDALDLKDARAMRTLLAEYLREFPNDPNQLQSGYAVIANCFEDPSESAREAAREYYARERASILRRYVRRACLETPSGQSETSSLRAHL